MTVSLVSRIVRWLAPAPSVTVTINNYTSQPAVVEETAELGERRMIITIGEKPIGHRPVRVSR